MFHTNRRWSLTAVTLDQLEDDLFNYTLVLCTAYKTLAGVIWANNATGINAAQEFAVLVKRQDQLVQVESISTGWCSRDRLTHYIHQAESGAWNDNHYGVWDPTRFDEDHATCLHCR